MTTPSTTFTLAELAARLRCSVEVAEAEIRGAIAVGTILAPHKRPIATIVGTGADALVKMDDGAAAAFRAARGL
ncbi:hypothetical protein [Pseudonocardia sp. T1-2H]|uniref:hypothetical protein n=1 Tax=Pseudonocardia sp. T1-2H TaxID=3128899 RepID=UPI003101880B